MKKTAICFTENGKNTIRRLNATAQRTGIEPAKAFICSENVPADEGFSKLCLPLDEFVKECFERSEALIFVGAAGIAVRAISGCVKDKLTDSPVIVIDDGGTFVIPILSGHAGGADKLAVMIASVLDAVPVVTTSSDVNGAFSADVFACENRLSIRNRDGIKKVSAKAIEGKNITISIKDYPPQNPVDIIIADDTDREYSLLLAPKEYVIGLGMRKDKEADSVESYILSVLEECGIDTDDIYAAATIDVKEDEPALQAFAQKYRIPVISFEASVLERARGDFSSSHFVKETVGVDNVCERAAVLAAGPKAELVMKKRKGEGITVAIARRSIH
ncbi:MAG: cobalamin biosynthesis protein [Lachnospiraceae bacterium]|nr:cobalamin biosynthesis protein [Lachnospiraceae bacterium]